MEDKPAPETVPVNIQLEQILKTSDPEELKNILSRLVNHRNINYQKVVTYITTFLKELALDYQQTLELLCRLSQAFALSHTRPYMSQHIFKGFEAYWKQFKTPLDSKQRIEGLVLYRKINTSFVEEFVGALYEEQYVEGARQSIVEQVWRNLENRELICGLKLIRCFRLLDKFDKERLADTLAKASPVLAEIDFFLKDAPVMSKLFASRLERHNNFKLCSDVVQKYKLPHTEFPTMLWELEKGYMNYYIRENPLYAVELKFSQSPRQLSYLVIRTFSNNMVWAESLMKKYNLYGNPIFEMEGCQQKAKLAEKRKDYCKPIKNILIQNDAFGATELRVLGQPEDYLELEDLLMAEEDVRFIDSLETDEFAKARTQLLDCSTIGLDCEFNSTTTKFEEYTLNLIQLATRKKVFIFDFQNLQKDPEFKKFLEQLFLDSKITFVVFGGKEDLGFIRKAIGKEGSDKAIKFIDMQTKTAAEKDNKEVQKVNSLKRCTEELYGKKFSKFEQCSAWNIRPLRKAQLHYAALDARVLLDIYDHRSPGPGQDEMREC